MYAGTSLDGVSVALERGRKSSSKTPTMSGANPGPIILKMVKCMIDKLKVFFRKYLLGEPAIHSCSEKCRFNLGGTCYKYSFEFGPCDYFNMSDGGYD